MFSQKSLLIFVFSLTFTWIAIYMMYEQLSSKISIQELVLKELVELKAELKELKSTQSRNNNADIIEFIKKNTKKRNEKIKRSINQKMMDSKYMISDEYKTEIKKSLELADREYEGQKFERNKATHEVYNFFGANWPCFWGEDIVADNHAIIKQSDKYGDGWKYTCGLRLITDPCVVYSLGSCGNMAFEKELLRMNPICKIFIFDKDNFGMEEWFTKDQIENNVIFTRAFISGKENLKADPPVYNLFTIMKKYNHNHIDVLKVDIEGSEFDLLSGKLPSIGQLLTEFHFISQFIGNNSPREIFSKAIDNIEKHGLRIFHKEVNSYSSECMEMSFIQREWLPDKKNYST